MAVVQNVLIGKSRGSVGNATLTTWKGENIMKSKAVNNYSDPTPVQVQNNIKFKYFQEFIKTISAFIVAGFKAKAVGKTEYNAFAQSNPLSTALTGSDGEYAVVPANLIISDGPELSSNIMSPGKSSSDANTIDINWNPSGSIPVGSKVWLAAFNNTTGVLVASSLGIVNAAIGEASLTGVGLGTAIATTTVKMFYVNSENGKACPSFTVPA